MNMEKKEISKPVLKRLPGYLAYLKNIPEGSSPYISATTLAHALGMGEVQVRKDLATVSDGGRPKIGYLRESLIEDIEQFLGYDNTTDAVLIGAGKLGQALLDYKGFAEYGLNILAAFDANPPAAQTDDGKPILPMEELEQFLACGEEEPELTEELRQVIQADRDMLSGSFCRGCGYCLPCPAGIEIPNAARMYLMVRRAPVEAYTTPEWKEKMKKIENCIGCNHCKNHCPYGLDTPNLLKENFEDYKRFL